MKASCVVYSSLSCLCCCFVCWLCVIVIVVVNRCLFSQAIPILLQHMKDPVVYVKDTTAWTLGRVCELHPGTIGTYLPQLIQTLGEGLVDSPRVAANVCWAIYNLALAYEEEAEETSSQMSPFYRPLLVGLVQ